MKVIDKTVVRMICGGDGGGNFNEPGTVDLYGSANASCTGSPAAAAVSAATAVLLGVMGAIPGAIAAAFGAGIYTAGSKCRTVDDDDDDEDD